jgi:zinc transport system substrate-binding protein
MTAISRPRRSASRAMAMSRLALRAVARSVVRAMAIRRSALGAMAIRRSALGAMAMTGLLTSAGWLHAAQGTPTLKIGITLHPYYSWTRNIVGTLPGYEIRSILPGDIDAGDYQPRPDDIKKLVDLDAIVVNGIGHDDFIFPMIKASGNKRIVVIRPNDATPQIRSAHGASVNSHTFISFTNAIQQTYAIQKALAALRPRDAAALQQNAADYARRLRVIKSRAASQLAEAKITRVVTVHDGYGYLLQEFGLEVAGVVQPSHGLTPSAAELRDMVGLLRREKIKVVFSEETFPPPLLKVLSDEAGVKVYIISHIASGPFTADRFEREMQANVDTMIRALVTEA